MSELTARNRIGQTGYVGIKDSQKKVSEGRLKYGRPHEVLCRFLDESIT